MKLKVHQVVDGFAALTNIVKTGDKYPTKLSYAIVRNLRILQPEVKTFEDKRLEILREFGKVSDEDPNKFELGDNYSVAAEKINDILSDEIDLLVHTINLEVLDIDFPVDAMMAIDWMFTTEVT